MLFPELIYLLTFPLVGSAIGWFTNHLAIKMLFHPREPMGLPFLKLQGLIPRRRRELAGKIGYTISQNLITEGEISSLLGRINWEDQVQTLVRNVLKQDLLPPSMHRLPGFSSLLENVNDKITGHILEALRDNSEQIIGRFHDELDVRAMVTEKILELDLAELETMIFSLVRRELRHIELIGAALGFVIGAVQSIIFYIGRV